MHNNQKKIHHPLPDHQKVESYEQSKDATAVSHKRSEGECLLLFSNKNSVAWEHWHQLLYTSSMRFYLFNNLHRQKILKSVSTVLNSPYTPCKNRAAGSLSFWSANLFHTLLHSNIPYCDFLALSYYHTEVDHLLSLSPKVTDIQFFWRHFSPHSDLNHNQKRHCMGCQPGSVFHVLWPAIAVHK